MEGFEQGFDRNHNQLSPSHEEVPQQFDWRIFMESVGGRITQNKERFGQMNGKPLYKKYRSAVNQQIRTYSQCTQQKPSYDENVVKKISWELQKVFDSYEPALAQEVEKQKATVNAKVERSALQNNLFVAGEVAHNPAERGRCCHYIKSVFNHYNACIAKDTKAYGRLPQWQAHFQQCQQEMGRYTQETPNGKFPSDPEKVGTILSCMGSIEQTLASYEKARESFPKPSAKTQAETLSGEEVPQQFNWRTFMENVGGRIAQNKERFGQMKGKPMYEKYRSTVNQHIRVYSKFAADKSFYDEKSLKTVSWELQKVFDSYEPALTQELEDKPEKKNWMSGLLSSAEAMQEAASSNPIVKQAAIEMNFRPSMTPVEIRERMLSLSQEQTFKQLTDEQLASALFVKAHLPEIGGENDRFNHEDVDAIAQSIVVDLFSRPGDLYKLILERKNMNENSADAAGLRGFFGIGTPQENADFQAKMQQLRSAPQQLAEGRAKLAEGAQKLSKVEGRPIIQRLFRRKISQGKAQYSQGLRQYQEGLQQYQEGLAKYNELQMIDETIHAAITEELRTGMDAAGVTRTNGVDRTQRNVPEVVMRKLEQHTNVLKGIGADDITLIEAATKRSIKVVSTQGLSLNTVDWLLAANSTPQGKKGMPPAGLIWIDDAPESFAAATMDKTAQRAP